MGRKIFTFVTFCVCVSTTVFFITIFIFQLFLYLIFFVSGERHTKKMKIIKFLFTFRIPKPSSRNIWHSSGPEMQRKWCHARKITTMATYRTDTQQKNIKNNNTTKYNAEEQECHCEHEIVHGYLNIFPTYETRLHSLTTIYIVPPPPYTTFVSQILRPHYWKCP